MFLLLSLYRLRCCLQVCWRSLSDLRSVRQKSTHAVHEIETLSRLREWVCNRLSQSRTSVEEDDERLSVALRQQSSNRLATAIAYRIEQKRLLLSFDRVLAILQAVVAACEK